jgi:hypothetical protein
LSFRAPRPDDLVLVESMGLENLGTFSDWEWRTKRFPTELARAVASDGALGVQFLEVRAGGGNE